MITAHADPKKGDKRVFYEFNDQTGQSKNTGEGKMVQNGFNT